MAGAKETPRQKLISLMYLVFITMLALNVSKEVLEKALAQMPRGHAMKPSEIAAWVGFLISPAGDVSSGNVIILNQGRDVR